MALVGLRLSGLQINETLNNLRRINGLHTYIVTDSGKIISSSTDAIEEIIFSSDTLSIGYVL